MKNKIPLLVILTLLLSSPAFSFGFKKTSERKQMSKAIQKGERKKMKRLFKSGMELQSLSEDDNQFTLLHEACYYQRPRIAKYFIKHGANVNERIHNHNAPLHSAMGPAGFEDSSAALQIVQLCLSCGAFVDTRGVHAATPLHLATEKNHYTEVMKELIAHGANIEAHCDNGWTPLIVAAVYENIKGAELLLEAGAELENSCNRKMTALSNACIEGKVKSVEFLLEEGANINSRGHAGETPLMLAAFTGRIAIVEILIAEGADLNARTTKKIELKKPEDNRVESLWDLIPWKKIPWISSRDVIPKKSTALDIAKRFGGTGVETALINAGAQASRGR